MATRGAKPTPLHLVQLRGNPGKRKLPDPAKEIRAPIDDDPTPPAHLCDDARFEWGRVVPLLVNLKLMTKLDRSSLAAYCAAYGRWVQAERALNAMAEKDMVTRGLMIDTVRGGLRQNPLVGAANKAMREMVHYAAEFGMTPSARVRLQNPGSGADANAFEDFRKTS